MRFFPFSRRSRKRAYLAFPLIFGFLLSGPNLRSGLQSAYSLEKAQKVLALIDHILHDQKPRTGKELKAVKVTENEFNAYMAYLIDVDREQVLREVYILLFNHNRIEGKIRLDLRGLKVPRFLKPEMSFHFAGRVDVQNGKARLSVRELFLEKEPVQPALLDLVILIVSRIQKLEPISLYDWYDLPYGIKDIKTEKGMAVFYY